MDRIGEVLLETADPEWGGWGARQKFPHPDALHMLLVRWSETGDERMLRTVTRTLRSMQGRPIRDELDGGFYRYATERDWSAPSAEKPLLSNAKRLLAYAEAYQVLGEPSFRDTALDIAAWMIARSVTRPAYRAGGAHPGPRAWHREDAPPPSPTVDPTIHADRNAGGHGPRGGSSSRSLVSSQASRRPDFVLARMLSHHAGVRLLERYLEPARDRGKAVLRALVDAVQAAVQPLPRPRAGHRSLDGRAPQRERRSFRGDLTSASCRPSSAAPRT